jgi:hypothetical protein
MSLAVIVLWTIIGLNELYQRYWPIKIIEHHFTEAMVLNPDKRVKKGGWVDFEYKYSKFKEISGTISRMLVNDRIVPLTSTECAVLPPGINQSKILSVYIPENMFPGRYYLVTSIKYPIGDNRIETVTYKTEWFEVVE